MTNKIIATMAMGAAAMLMGCASSAPRVAALGPVGPCSHVKTELTGDGALTVYTARRSANIDINAQEFFWNNDFGRNDFLYETAHTDYDIYRADGTLFKHVRNARNANDDKPSAVKLPPGTYTIEAEAEREGGMAALSVVVPVIVDEGLVTTVHLEPKWSRRAAQDAHDDLVRLPDGRIIGCKARELAPAVAASH